MADFTPPNWKRLLPTALSGPVSARALIEDELYAPRNVGRWARKVQARLEQQANDSEKEALALHKLKGAMGSPLAKAIQAEEQRRVAMAVRFWQLHGCPDTPHTVLVPVGPKLKKGRFK